MAAYVKLTCPKHPSYQAVRMPRAQCGPCCRLWEIIHMDFDVPLRVERMEKATVRTK